jgi:hypothetical protein
MDTATSLSGVEPVNFREVKILPHKLLFVANDFAL